MATIYKKGLSGESPVLWAGGLPSKPQPALFKRLLECARTARPPKPQPAPVEGLAALLAHCVRCGACIARLPGAGCPFESHPHRSATAPHASPASSSPAATTPSRAGSRLIRRSPGAPRHRRSVYNWGVLSFLTVYILHRRQRAATPTPALAHCRSSTTGSRPSASSVTGSADHLVPTDAFLLHRTATTGIDDFEEHS